MTGASGSSGENKNIKSKKSTVSSFVRFQNRTDRSVDIIWLNYEGARIRYKTLHAYEFVDVNTFVGHPWIFLDVESGERLVVDLKEVFESTTGWVPGEWPIIRKTVNITIPVYTLKDSCMRFFRRNLTREKLTRLDLPNTLIKEMQEKFHTPAITSSLKSTATATPPSEDSNS